MDGVIEVREIRKIVHPCPTDRRAVLEAVAHRLQYFAVGPNLRVAVHAYRRRGDSRERGNFDRRMTVPTIDAEAAHMVIMAERHGLDARHVFVGYIRGPVDRGHQPEQTDNQEQCAKYTQARKGVRAAVKNLRHTGVKCRVAQCDFSPVWMIGKLRNSATNMPPDEIFPVIPGPSANRSERQWPAVLLLKQARDEAPICETEAPTRSAGTAKDRPVRLAFAPAQNAAPNHQDRTDPTQR